MTSFDDHSSSPPFCRVEDDTLLRGQGRFIDDGQDGTEAVAWFVRSPHANARICALDVAAARQHPGVLAVLTAAEIAAAGVGNVARPLPVVGRSGAPMWVPHRPALADARVLHVGQPVVLIVAETMAAAQDAAERVEVDYESLPAVADVRAALAPGAPQLWPEAPGNVAVDWPGPVPDFDARTSYWRGDANYKVRVTSAPPLPSTKRGLNPKAFSEVRQPGARPSYQAGTRSALFHHFGLL